MDCAIGTSSLGAFDPPVWSLERVASRKRWRNWKKGMKREKKTFVLAVEVSR